MQLTTKQKIKKRKRKAAAIDKKELLALEADLMRRGFFDLDFSGVAKQNKT